jgi:hypothetical protein
MQIIFLNSYFMVPIVTFKKPNAIEDLYLAARITRTNGTLFQNHLSPTTPS